MKAKIIIPTLVLGAVALGGCSGGGQSSALPDCRSYRAAISRAYSDPESQALLTGLTKDDALAVTNDREAFQADISKHAGQIASRQAARTSALAAGPSASDSLGDALGNAIARTPVTDDTAQYLQSQLTKWQAYVDKEIPRILSRQGCAA